MRRNSDPHRQELVIHLRRNMHLVALIDVYSRYIVGWRLSTTLETSFCVEALESAIDKGKPDIVNTDQGCQRVMLESGVWKNKLGGVSY